MMDVDGRWSAIRITLESQLLGLIGVAQSAGFKLREIKQLIDGADGLGAPMRSLSSQKLGEVEAPRAHQGDERVA